MRKPNRKQQVFIQEYLRDFNATQAAIRAGYSPRAAGAIGHKLLKIAEIDAAISDAISERYMAPSEILTRLADIARGDIAEFMDFTSAGYSLNLTERDEIGQLRPKAATKLIKKIKQRVTTIMPRSGDGEEREIIETEIELYNAQDALVTLGKHHKLFADGAVDVTLNPGDVFRDMLDKIYGGGDNADD